MILEKENITKWNNEDNTDFYGSLSISWFMGLNQKVGLDRCDDLKLIHDYIERSEDILELGASYGRVVKHILDNYKKNLVVVERSEQFVEYLMKLYSDKIEIQHQSISNLELNKKFDLIFWLWSGICDFSRNEQSLILMNLKRFLKTDGVLVLETINSEEMPLTSVNFSGQNHLLYGDNGTSLHVYLPNVTEMELYSREGNFSNYRYIKYSTYQGSNRILHIFTA